MKTPIAGETWRSKSNPETTVKIVESTPDVVWWFNPEIWGTNCGTSFQSFMDSMEPCGNPIDALKNEILCACNAITDSVLCSGNDPKTTLHFVRKLRALAE